VLWLVSHDFAYLLCLQLFAGSAWAAVEFATLLSFFEGIEERDRASVLSAYNLGNALAIALGALIGSRLFAWLDDPAGVYAWLFALSTLGRLCMLPILRGTASARRVVEMQLRTLAVRPSAGAVERPILASLECEPEGAGAAPPGVAP
jgi:MFS family permease